MKFMHMKKRFLQNNYGLSEEDRSTIIVAEICYKRRQPKNLQIILVSIENCILVIRNLHFGRIVDSGYYVASPPIYLMSLYYFSLFLQIQYFN
jgi:hypothetical protein